MTLPLVLLVLISSGPDWINAYEIGDCGIRYNKVVPAIANGTSTKYNEFPWHVALYKLGNTSTYEYICGGSIIDANVILTAAHCVFDDAKQDLDYSRMVIIAGKHNGSWAHRDVHEQRIEVLNKRVPSTYRGLENRFQDDIALLALNESIKFSAIVMPVCFDRGGKFEPDEGEIGTFVGWGYDETGKLSEDLQVCRMQQRNFGECRNSVGKDYTSFLTSDKFCASNKDNTSVQQGDSGGGVVFVRDKYDNKTSPRYFVKGILSGREVDGKNYILFTNISSHIIWINSTLMTIDAETEARKVCGKRYPQNVTENDIEPRHEEYPWIATIYMKKQGKFFGIRCAATIIHKRAILTSYWCINDNRPHYKGVEFEILLGKNELNMKEYEDTEQRLSIVRKYKQPNLVDWSTRAENELVILIVDEDIKFSKSVVPICMDLDRKYPIADTPVGMITSWDIDECHCQVMSMYKYLGIEDCREAFSDFEKYETYVTSEKVCSKYINGTRFLYGSDLGAGYFFLNNETSRHYLQGVVSKGRPSYEGYLILNSVELSIRWISDIMVAIYNAGF